MEFLKIFLGLVALFLAWLFLFRKKWLFALNEFMRKRGWNDAGYNYAIMPSGRVYELRGFGVRGAGVAGYNTDRCHIAFPGTYTTDKPTRASVTAYGELIKRLERHGARIRSVKGHGDLAPTTCPGNGIRSSLHIPKH